jgi:thioredoxin-like negative regulator of GroEL
MVKVNIDENRRSRSNCASSRSPPSTPSGNGQPVDGFMGAIPESQVKTVRSRA